MLEGERVEPQRFDDEACDDDGEATRPGGSLADDLVALIEDGKTFAEAEIAFQKARLAFSAEKGRSAALLWLLAIALIHLALVALVVGAVIALSPILTPLGATALVTAILVLAAIFVVRVANRRIEALSDAFQEQGE